MQPKDIRKWEIFWHFQGIIKVKFDLKYAKLQSQPLEISGQSKLTYTYIKERVKWKHWVPIGVPIWVLQKSNFIKAVHQTGHLKTPGTQLGYLFVWLSKLMTRPFFSQFWLAKDISTRLPVCCFIYKKTVNFLRTSMYYFLFAFNQIWTLKIK